MSTAIFEPEGLPDDADHKSRLFGDLHATQLHLQLYLPMVISYLPCIFSRWKDCTPEEKAQPDANCGYVPAYEPCKPDQFAKDPFSCRFERFVESPPEHLCRMLLIFMFIGTVLFSRVPRKLKNFAFLVNTVATFTLRVLTSFSATATETSSTLIIWNSNSYWKPLFLWFLIELWVWEWSYLGTFSDTHFNSVRPS
jgi:hypothetical protein